MQTEKLERWFKKQKRDLPWRGSPTPYQVWISEVMLQQTQASVVVEYFHRWLSLFPSIEALSLASIEEVMKAWEGLGYYSRARNLHQGARYLMEHHGGKIPATVETLKKVPGIGPYTAGAILSFAHHQKAPAVDGNVLRVIARLYQIEEEITLPSTQKRIEGVVLGLLPEEEPWVVMEALIELGACVCKKKPECGVCPMQRECRGKGEAERLPFKGKKTEITPLFRSVGVFQCEDLLLVRKGDPGKVMADLYEFPYGESRIGLEGFGLEGVFVKELPEERHTFTRYRVTLSPALWKVKEARPIRGYLWVSVKEVGNLPFSSGHKRILQRVLDAYFTH